MEAAVRSAIAAMEELGAEPRDVSLPSMEYAAALLIPGMVDGLIAHEPYIEPIVRTTAPRCCTGLSLASSFWVVTTPKR